MEQPIQQQMDEQQAATAAFNEQRDPGQELRVWVRRKIMRTDRTRSYYEISRTESFDPKKAVNHTGQDEFVISVQRNSPADRALQEATNNLVDITLLGDLVPRGVTPVLDVNATWDYENNLKTKPENLEAGEPAEIKSFTRQLEVACDNYADAHVVQKQADIFAKVLEDAPGSPLLAIRNLDGKTVQDIRSEIANRL